MTMKSSCGILYHLEMYTGIDNVVCGTSLTSTSLDCERKSSASPSLTRIAHEGENSRHQVLFSFPFKPHTGVNSTTLTPGSFSAKTATSLF